MLGKRGFTHTKINCTYIERKRSKTNSEKNGGLTGKGQRTFWRYGNILPILGNETNLSCMHLKCQNYSKICKF